jgi:hypothetical protein
VQVIPIEQVREEFGGGSNDPTAIRDLMKMYYDRARNTPADRPRYLLLMGAGSYDPKNRVRNNDRPIPVYQSPESLDPLGTYCTDDYFGFLDDAEDINNPAISNLLDLGIGRIPARTPLEAMTFVDKLIAYDDTTAMGSWPPGSTHARSIWMHFVNRPVPAARVIQRPIRHLTEKYSKAISLSIIQVMAERINWQKRYWFLGPPLRIGTIPAGCHYSL